MSGTCKIPREATVREVCPRDGFQSVKEYIPLEKKSEIIDELAGTGISCMEVTSFVSPKAIPQMKDASEVMVEYNRKWKGKVKSYVLVPNLRGAQDALKTGPDSLNFVISASEAHNKANTRRTVKESLEELKKVAEIAGDAELTVSVATAFECPFAGAVSPERVIEVLDAVFGVGVQGVTLADTIGTANPAEVRRTLTKVKEKYGDYPFYLHLHDTHGMALANTMTALELGFTRFDAATGGLGGCPFAPGAAGNLATEDLVNFLEKIGVSTGVDLLKTVKIARELETYGLNVISHLAASNVGREGSSCCCQG
jgi:hydroxymethylglutaryl-CoA lyase